MSKKKPVSKKRMKKVRGGEIVPADVDFAFGPGEDGVHKPTSLSITMTPAHEVGDTEPLKTVIYIIPGVGQV